MIKVLLVDNDPLFLEAFLRSLERDGDIDVQDVRSNEKAIEEIGRTSYDVVVGECWNPEVDGPDLLRTLRSNGEDIPFIVFTEKSGEGFVIEALNNGADFYLQKKGSLVTIIYETRLNHHI